MAAKDHLGEMQIIDVDPEKVEFSEHTGEWCQIAYPRHPKGCPNYDDGKPHCPPDAPKFEDFIDMDEPMIMVVQAFDMGAYMRAWLEKHPGDSEAMQRNPLYWQGTVKKRLRDACSEFIGDQKGLVYTLCPEGMGMQVFITAKRHGIVIDKRPTEWLYKVAFVGFEV